jgi:3-methyladenine DNA glycosylase AlkD
MTLEQVIKRLQVLADPEKILIKQRKFGIIAKNSLGIYHQDLKPLAKEIGPDNALALALFDCGIYEAKILCSKIYDPHVISSEQMDKWLLEFDNWEICDSFCMGFFAKSPHALSKAMVWSADESEFTKRAGFVIMAAYGFANKKADNALFEQFFQPIQDAAEDPRLYVKKAVNWTLRNIGKRNRDLHKKALLLAHTLLNMESKSAKWIARNAINELNKPSVSMLDYPRSIYRP